ncbi:MAG: hypothetical protein JW996_02580 [Candidatus Cloacimonetes bacterium]|nr:hypothetical protein [Candidatus Cloacimonadota bacterium]
MADINILKSVLITILISLLGACAVEKIEVINLTALDSLGWQADAEYEFSKPFGMVIFAGELYLLDQGMSRIGVYDVDDMSFRRFIGNKGKGPGEFEMPLSLTITSDSVLIVNDLGNRRLQYLGLEGEFLASRPSENLWMLDYCNSVLSGNAFPFYPDPGIYSIYQDSLSLEYCPRHLYQKTDEDDAFKNYYTYTMQENSCLIAFMMRVEAYLVNLDNPDDQLKLDLSGCQKTGRAVRLAGGFLLPVQYGNDNEAADPITELHLFDPSGKITQKFRLQGNRNYFLEGAAVCDGYFYIFDMFDCLVFKYKLPIRSV